MKRLGGVIVSILLLLTIFWPTGSGAEPEMPEVIINELAWAGSSVSSSDEWIELKNTTDQNQDISGWQVTKKTDTASPMVTITVGSIPPHGYFLISNYSETSASSVLDIQPDIILSSVSLSNEELAISLYKGDWHNPDNLVDIAGDGNKPDEFCQGSGNQDNFHVSMERNATYEAGDVKESWHSANTSSHFDLGKETANKGTPKDENSIPPIILLSPTIDHIVPPVPAEATIDTDFVIEEIIGANFAVAENLQIKLEKGNSSISATDWQRISDTTLTQIRFHIPIDAETGEWDLIVTNTNQPDTPAILINAVEIVEPEEEPEIPTYSENISLSELYPHPATGAEEFIELYNSGDNSVNLKGWKLDDQSPGGSAVYTIPNDIIISPHQYLIFPKSQTHLYLNDTGDQARLLQPNDVVVEVTPNYGTATTGYSYSKINSNWQWSKRVTPNAVNIYESIAEDDDDDTTVPDSDPTSLQPNEVTIKLEADDLAPTSITLIWQVNLIGALGEMEIYQSDKATVLGRLIGSTAPNKLTYSVDKLISNTTYYFTTIGTYNADDIRSNQIKVTTLKTNQGVATIKNNSGVSKQILINEILPNPNAGDNEFIELYNPGSQAVDITNWKLLDASGKAYIINAFDLSELVITDTEEDSDDIVILEPGQYLLLEYPVTHIRLNNSGGEEVQLTDGADNLIDEMDYAGSTKPGYAYVLAPNGQWFWSNETTPGEANDISFASWDEESGSYLVDSGSGFRWMSLVWLSLIISAIIGTRLRKYGYSNLYHQ